MYFLKTCCCSFVNPQSSISFCHCSGCFFSLSYLSAGRSAPFSPVRRINALQAVNSSTFLGTNCRTTFPPTAVFSWNKAKMSVESIASQSFLSSNGSLSGWTYLSYACRNVNSFSIYPCSWSIWIHWPMIVICCVTSISCFTSPQNSHPDKENWVMIEPLPAFIKQAVSNGSSS